MISLPTLEIFLRRYVMGAEPTADHCRAMLANLVPQTKVHEIDEQYWIGTAGPAAVVVCEGEKVIGAQTVGAHLWVDRAHRGQGLGVELVKTLYRHVGLDRWCAPTLHNGPHVYTPAGLRTLKAGWRALGGRMIE